MERRPALIIAFAEKKKPKCEMSFDILSLSEREEEEKNPL